MKFVNSSEYTNGASKLTRILDKLGQNNCEITVVGAMASKLVRQEKSSLSFINIIENASVVWEFLKGRKLPGVMAVDRVCLDKNYFLPLSSTKYFRIIMQCMLKIFYCSKLPCMPLELALLVFCRWNLWRRLSYYIIYIHYFVNFF